MTRLCRDKNALAHDDRLDAVTMAVSYWLEVMDSEQDASKQEEDWDIEDLLTIGIYKTDTRKNKCLKNIRELRS